MVVLWWDDSANVMMVMPMVVGLVVVTVMVTVVMTVIAAPVRSCRQAAQSTWNIATSNAVVLIL